MCDIIKIDLSEIQAALEHIMCSKFDEYWHNSRRFPNTLSTYKLIRDKMIEFICQNRKVDDTLVQINIGKRKATGEYVIYAFIDGTYFFFDLHDSENINTNLSEFSLVFE